MLAGPLPLASVHAEGRNCTFPVPAMPLKPSDYNRNRSQREALDTLRMGVMVYGRISREEADAQVRRMRDMGYNIVLTDGQRYLFVEAGDKRAPLAPGSENLFGCLPFSELVTHTKYVVEACHKYGLKAYLHLTASVVVDPLPAVHPDWMSISLKDGKPALIWGLQWACLNNDGYRKAYYDRLDHLIAETRPDGLMVDEYSLLSDRCGCVSCRTKFRQDTGYEMPSSGTPWLGRSWLATLQGLPCLAYRGRQRY